VAVTQGEVQQAQELARAEKARAEAIAARRHAAREIEAELGVQVLQEELLQLPRRDQVASRMQSVPPSRQWKIFGPRWRRLRPT